MSLKIEQWFWKWGYIAIAVAVVLGFWISQSDERENQAHVNPAVFAFFDKVELDCRAQSFETQSSQCSGVFKYQKECKMLTSHCDSLSFYQHLKSLGFHQPQYYQEGYAEK